MSDLQADVRRGPGSLSGMALPPRRLRLSWILLLACLVLGGPGTGSTAADPEPEAPPPPVWPRVETDPGGDATRLLETARRHGLAEQWEAAGRALIRMAEDFPETVVPAHLPPPRSHVVGRAAIAPDIEPGWPARRVAQTWLATLPPESWARVRRVWQSEAEALLPRVQGGDFEALTTLADRYAVLDLGRQALLLLADRALEGGQATEALRHLARWLEVSPHASEAERARMVMREVDALASLPSAGGRNERSWTHKDILGVPVRVGGRTVTLAERLLLRQSPRTLDHIPSAAVQGAPFPTRLRLAWSTQLDDADWVPTESAFERDSGDPRLDVAVVDEHLLVHEGRRVRCLDLESGLERWRFPAGELAHLHRPSQRYRDHDIPWRCVTIQGDSAYVVMGDPEGTGNYRVLREDINRDNLGHELRARLVCLDVRTGRVRWMSGGARETHPILGDPRTSCTAPPRIVGDCVYAVFGRLEGVGEYYLACLDRETGAARWVRFLGTGVSGRSPDMSAGQRFGAERLQTLAFGQRPTVAAGEVCVVPHAGFVAGVDAASGAVRWIRKLPRYRLDGDAYVHFATGHSVRNAPIPHGDAWIVAPMDSPWMCAIAQGSGKLRWGRGATSPDKQPPGRNVFGIGRDPTGRPRILIGGPVSVIVDPVTGKDVPGDHEAVAWRWDEYGDSGAPPTFANGWVYRVQDGALQARAFFGDPTLPREEAHTVDLPRDLPESGVPVRAGRHWVVFDADRVFVLESATSKPRPPPQVHAGATPEALARALVASRTSDASTSVEDFAQIVAWCSERTRGDAASPLARVASREVGRWLREHQSRLRPARMERVVALLPQALRGQHRAALVNRALAEGEGRVALDLLTTWLGDAGTSLVDVPSEAADGLRIREDLLAGQLLARVLELPDMAEAEAVRAALLAARGAPHLERLQAGKLPDAALERFLIEAAGTEMAFDLRVAAANALEDADRPGEALRWLAEARLRPFRGPRAARVSRRGLLARLQLREAELSWQLGHADHGRSLIIDLARWADGIVRSGRGERPGAIRDRWLRDGVRGPAVPEDRLLMWPADRLPKEGDVIRSLRFAGIEGPGAPRMGDRILLARGLAVECWSVSQRKRLFTLRPPGAGWFGGSLAGIDRWVPGQGLRVKSVVPNEPADRSGVRGGDWLRSWDGARILDLPTFMRRVADTIPGQTVPISVVREGREVLSSFTAGRRPLAQTHVLDLDRLWSLADGRVLWPGRTGLFLVDLERERLEPLWRHDGTGLIVHVRVFAGTAYVVISRRSKRDLLVAVDLDTGVRRWSTELEGIIDVERGLVVSAAGIWVATERPTRAYIVDPSTGGIRLQVNAHAFERDRHVRTRMPPLGQAGTVLGRGFVVTGQHPYPQALLCINMASGAIEWRDGDFRAHVAPHLAADVFCAAVKAIDHLHIYVPDPLGGGLDAPLAFQGQAARASLRVQHRHGGRFDEACRLACAGDRLAILRMPNQREVTVFLTQLDEAAVRAPRATNSPGPDPLDVLASDHFTGAERPFPNVLQFRATHDGAFVRGGFLGGETRVRSVFFSETAPAKLQIGPAIRVARHAPVFTGRYWIEPTDHGCLVSEVAR